MKTRYILMLTMIAAVMVSATACEEVVVPQYEDVERLNFYRGNEADSYYRSGQHDSIAHSFFFLDEDIMTDTIWVDVRTMGYNADFDRPMKFEQINTNHPDAARPGVHYVGFDNAQLIPRLMMPRDSVRQLIPIVLLRHDDTLDRNLRIEFEIRGNEHFEPGIADLQKFLVTTTQKPDKPSMWDGWWGYAFGNYGDEKLRFIVHVVGFTGMDDYSSVAYRESLKSLAKERLAELNKQRVADGLGPLTEADGTVVVMP